MIELPVKRVADYDVEGLKLGDIVSINQAHECLAIVVEQVSHLHGLMRRYRGDMDKSEEYHEAVALLRVKETTLTFLHDLRGRLDPQKRERRSAQLDARTRRLLKFVKEDSPTAYKAAAERHNADLQGLPSVNLEEAK